MFEIHFWNMQVFIMHENAFEWVMLRLNYIELDTSHVSEVRDVSKNW